MMYNNNRGNTGDGLLPPLVKKLTAGCERPGRLVFYFFLKSLTSAITAMMTIANAKSSEMLMSQAKTPMNRKRQCHRHHLLLKNSEGGNFSLLPVQEGATATVSGDPPGSKDLEYYTISPSVCQYIINQKLTKNLQKPKNRCEAPLRRRAAAIYGAARRAIYTAFAVCDIRARRVRYMPRSRHARDVPGFAG